MTHDLRHPVILRQGLSTARAGRCVTHDLRHPVILRQALSMHCESIAVALHFALPLPIGNLAGTTRLLEDWHLLRDPLRCG